VDDETGKTRHDGQDKTRHDAPIVVLDVAATARRLGITEDAVRRRIARGKLDAHKGADGRWRIVFGVVDTPQNGTPDETRHDKETGPDRGRGYATTHTPTGTTGWQDKTRQDNDLVDVAQSQLETLREGLVAPLTALIAEQQAQLIDQAAQIGRLAQQRDILQAHVAALEEVKDANDENQPVATQPERGRRWFHNLWKGR
jgi:hypothetical protein